MFQDFCDKCLKGVLILCGMNLGWGQLHQFRKVPFQKFGVSNVLLILNNIKLIKSDSKDMLQKIDLFLYKKLYSLKYPE